VSDGDLLGTHIRAALASWKHEDLLSTAALDEICRSQAACLPAKMTSRFGFECRLGEQEPLADFLVRAGAHKEEWLTLEHYAAGLTSLPWTGIRSLLGSRAELKNLWLEYDLVTQAIHSCVPSVFLGPNELASGAATEGAANALGTLRGCPLPLAVRRALQDVVEALPKKAKLFQAGVMCSRPGSPLRVCLLGPEFKSTETGSVRNFLAATHWPLDSAPVTDLLKNFASLIDHLAFDLDIREDGTLAPKLGIEIYQNSNGAPADRMVELVNYLTRFGLCTRKKANGLLAWNGITHERLHPKLWPRSLVAARVIRGAGQYSTFCRWLHHVKLVYEPGVPFAAKAYLAVSHAFLTDSAIREALYQFGGTVSPASG
jgi:hypothetical protein